MVDLSIAILVIQRVPLLFYDTSMTGSIPPWNHRQITGKNHHTLYGSKWATNFRLKYFEPRCIISLIIVRMSIVLGTHFLKHVWYVQKITMDLENHLPRIADRVGSE